MEIKKLLINSKTIAHLLYRKLSNSAITTVIIVRLPITNFGNFNKITLVEKDFILEKNDILRKLLMVFFTSVVSNSNIPRYQDPFNDSDQTENQIGKYKNHQSIIAINNQTIDRRFSF